MYCLDVAQLMYVHAADLCFEDPSIDSAQDHNHPEFDVLATGAAAKPSFPATALFLGSSTTEAPTVASYHIAALPCCSAFAYSLKLKFAAPSSPAVLTRLTWKLTAS